MEPTTAAMIAKAAIAVDVPIKGLDWNRFRNCRFGCLPFILIIVCILSIASGGQIITGLLSVWHFEGRKHSLRYAC